MLYYFIAGLHPLFYAGYSWGLNKGGGGNPQNSYKGVFNKGRGGKKNFKISGPLEIFFVVKVYETLRDSKYKFTF